MTHVFDTTVTFESDGTVTLEASPEALVALAEVLIDGTEAVIDLVPTAAAQGELARAIHVRIEEAPGLAVWRDRDDLVVAGATPALEVLAANLTDLGQGSHPPGYHSHIEYFPDHYYLRPSSVPLVVTVR
jgi:hypothetical protein